MFIIIVVIRLWKSGRNFSACVHKGSFQLPTLQDEVLKTFIIIIVIKDLGRLRETSQLVCIMDLFSSLPYKRVKYSLLSLLKIWEHWEKFLSLCVQWIFSSSLRAFQLFLLKPFNEVTCMSKSVMIAGTRVFTQHT